MKPKILYVNDIRPEHQAQDGFVAALKILEDDFEFIPYNVLTQYGEMWPEDIDAVLGRGNWGGKVELVTRNLAGGYPHALMICGNAVVPHPEDYMGYRCLFYETPWQQKQVEDHKNLIHAFGINTTINHHFHNDPIIDYLTVGAFSYWKRQHLLANKKGIRLAIGEIQRDNQQESLDIIGTLLLKGCGVMDSVTSEQLADFYRISKTVYLPAELDGGSERAVLEARACGCKVEVEPDNPKLKWLLTTPIWSEYYYAEQLKKGLTSIL